MEICKEIVKNLNDQLNFEFESAYLYLAMSVELDAMDYQGMAKWMRAQSSEELAHGTRLLAYLSERAAKVELAAIAKPGRVADKVLKIFESALAHEEKVTARIQEIAEKAMTAKDLVTLDLMKEYLKEQMEEEFSLSTIVGKLKMAGDSQAGLLFLDAELGKRE